MAEEELESPSPLEVLRRAIKAKSGEEPRLDRIQGTVERWMERMRREAVAQDLEDTATQLPIEYLIAREGGVPRPCGLWSADQLRRMKYSGEKRGNDSSNLRKGKLTPRYMGSGQSPIDIRDNQVKYLTMDKLGFWGEIFKDDYGMKYKMWNDGHTIKVSLEPPREGYLIQGAGIAGGTEYSYKFDQLHFHWSEDSRSGTEHALNGQRFAIEAHFVFTRESRTKGIEIAVIGLLFKEENNAPFYQVFSNFEKVERAREKGQDEVQFPRNDIKAFEKFMSGPYFSYMGSLTTPPYTEGVLWIVMKDVAGIRSDQVTDCQNRIVQLRLLPY